MILISCNFYLIAPGKAVEYYKKPLLISSIVTLVAKDILLKFTDDDASIPLNIGGITLRCLRRAVIEENTVNRLIGRLRGTLNQAKIVLFNAS